MGSVPRGLQTKFALTSSAGTLLGESQLQLVSWRAVDGGGPGCVRTALVASNTGLIYCPQGYLGERAEQPVGSLWVSHAFQIHRGWYERAEVFPPTPPVSIS